MDDNMTLLSVHKTYFSQYRLTASRLRSSLRAGSSAKNSLHANANAKAEPYPLHSPFLHDVTAPFYHIPNSSIFHPLEFFPNL